MSRIRNWCFTYNNHNQAVIDHLLAQVDPDNPEKLLNYLVMQEETGENGTPHLQGYMECHKAMRMRTIKTKMLPHRGFHLEARRGGQAQAIAYCKKTDTRTGRMFEQGTKKRSRGNGAISLIIAGSTMSEVAEAFPAEFVRNYRGLQQLQLINAPKRTWAMEIHIFYGLTGTGKSYKAFHDWPEAYTVAWPGASKQWWWPNYQGQETCVMDEFRHQITFGDMIRIMDRYPLQVQSKGGFFNFCSKRLVITTNIDPEDWYVGVDHRGPYLRRLKEFAKIYDFDAMTRDEEGTPVPHWTLRNMDNIRIRN